MNTLLVTIDCLRRDRCGIYGHHRETTPTLDAIARDGFVFDQAYATGPVTTESFPGILAGRLSAHCVTGNDLYQKRLPEGAPTIASHLRDRGWSTAAVISNPRIGAHVGLDRGFEVFRNLRTSSGGAAENDLGWSSYLPDIRVGERLYQLRGRMRDFDSLPLRYELPFLALRSYQYLTGWPSVRGERVIDEFLDTLIGRTSPFFAWTHLMDVHGPLHPRIVAAGGLSDGSVQSQFRSHAKRVSDIHDPRTEARYDSAVRYADDQLRRIVDRLQERGLWDETAVIVTADHGDALYDRGIYGHPQHYLYDELLRVPLVVRVPSIEGRRIEQPFSLGWLHEIVAELCDVPPMDVPLLSSRESHLSAGEDSEVLLADSVSHRGHSIVALQGRTKYVRQTGELCGIDETEVGIPGVYQLSADPAENAPLDDREPTLERALEEIKVDDPENLLSEGENSGIDEETRDRLQQLGYAE